MILSDVQEMLIRQEGCKLKPYRCTAGKLTIGCGRNLSDSGITKEEALMLLTNDIKACYAGLSVYFFVNQFDTFPEPVQNVLISMRYQLGHSGFKQFKKMIFAAKNEDWGEMIAQMRDSRWYGQVTNRADELIKMVESV